MSWKGLSMVVDVFANHYPTIIFNTDFTAFAVTLIPFLLLSILHVSGSLVAKGAEMDGSMEGGLGVVFSRSYSAIVYDNFFETSSKKRK